MRGGALQQQRNSPALPKMNLLVPATPGCEGISAMTTLVILAWHRLEGDSIRQPSGFIQARADWRELSEADRLAVGELVSESTGVQLRARRAA